MKSFPLLHLRKCILITSYRITRCTFCLLPPSSCSFNFSLTGVSFNLISHVFSWDSSCHLARLYSCRKVNFTPAATWCVTPCFWISPCIHRSPACNLTHPESFMLTQQYSMLITTFSTVDATQNIGKNLFFKSENGMNEAPLISRHCLEIAHRTVREELEELSPTCM